MPELYLFAYCRGGHTAAVAEYPDNVEPNTQISKAPAPFWLMRMLAESFVKNVSLICRQHLILVDMLQPEGATPVFHHENVGTLDDVYRHLGGHWQWHKLRELEKVLKSRGVRFNQLDPAKLPAQLVAQHADVKARQLV